MVDTERLARSSAVRLEEVVAPASSTRRAPPHWSWTASVSIWSWKQPASWYENRIAVPAILLSVIDLRRLRAHGGRTFQAARDRAARLRL